MSGFNLAELLAALEDAKVKHVVIGGIAVGAGKNLTVDTRAGMLDVVQRLPALPPYEELEGEGEKATLLGTDVVICSLAHLRLLKERGGRSQDRADLDNLPS